MSANDRVYRDNMGVGRFDSPLVRRFTSQNSVVVTPTRTNEMIAQTMHHPMTPSCSCHEIYSTEHTPEVFAAYTEVGMHSSRPPSRLASISPQSSIIQRSSRPMSRAWSYQQSASPSPHVTPRVAQDMQHVHAATGTVEMISPRLTRTQRSYINASPPSARETLTMRFIKANMTHSPRHEPVNQVSHAYAQSTDHYPLTRNASAPVNTLTRTSSIQPQFATRSPNTVVRRSTMQSFVHRQISEPVVVHNPNVAPVQREIEALNRAMQEFHENLSISPRVVQEAHESQPTSARPSEPDSVMHTMYEPCPSPRDRVTYHGHMIQPELMNYYEQRPEQLQYVPPAQVYYSISNEPEPVQEQTILGLPDEIISQFPVTEYDEVAAEKWDEDVKTCTICLEQYTRGDRIRRLACAHGYHKVCIDEWLTRSTMCPICKFDYIIMLS
ncbi:hypothetical protein BgAZ_206370 [Babesia gibsoni]|uniref:RING-type domain-containing protein n=1 Tax=Babesia gibsoni TaxID=33632 RepID=A0AAD8PEB7_BABGI|nr:hypothetical protein BgAZ_206370 [Babesia gibsoni]